MRNGLSALGVAAILALAACGPAKKPAATATPAAGETLNIYNWSDYIDPALLEVWRGAGEYGACGIGEGTVTCTPRSVLNAIYNAIGVRIDDIPVKPEKVLRALGKA